MRAVLQVEQHPVPGMHAAVLLQMAGQRFDFAQRLAVAQRRSLEVQQGLSGVRRAMASKIACRVPAGAGRVRGMSGGQEAK